MIPMTQPRDARAAVLPLRADDGEPETEDTDASLDEAASREQDYLRRRLRDELGREPTDAELNEWLREHTEGY
jgi:hypothetical protein